MPLRVIFRRAIEDGDLAVNPTAHLRLPAVRGRRERIASPEEAKRLLAALPARDRAVWATALYAGVALDRLQDVADALGLEIEETATYATTRYRDVDDGEAFEHYADPAHRDPALAIEPRLINSRAENAINAQIFALKVIWLCLHKPKKGLASLTSWCEQ